MDEKKLPCIEAIDEDEGAWFEYPGTCAAFKIRRLLIEKRRGIEETCTVKAFGLGGQPTSTVDHDRYNLMMLDYIIREWRGVTLKGQPLELTYANKGILPWKAKEFVLDCAARVNLTDAEEKKTSSQV